MEKEDDTFFLHQAGRRHTPPEMSPGAVKRSIARWWRLIWNQQVTEISEPAYQLTALHGIMSQRENCE